MGSAKELDNANPTILSASELQSQRQRRKGRDASAKEEGIREILMAKPSYALDPFYLSEYSDTDSDDDSTLEPIDEQEIYGRFRSLLVLFSCWGCSLVLQLCYTSSYRSIMKIEF
jgi:hypothetical protein